MAKQTKADMPARTRRGKTKTMNVTATPLWLAAAVANCHSKLTCIVVGWTSNPFQSYQGWKSMIRERHYGVLPNPLHHHHHHHHHHPSHARTSEILRDGSTSSQEDFDYFVDPLEEEKEQQRREEDLQEIFQAEKRAEKDCDETSSYNDKYNPQQLGQEKLPDMNPFRKQLKANADGGVDTLSESLSFPDYEKKQTTRQQQQAQQQPKPEQTSTTFSSSSKKPTTSMKVEEENLDYSDGFYLAPDVYRRSRDLLHGDGSLDLETTANDNDDNELNRPDGRKYILEWLLQSELESNQNQQHKSAHSHDHEGKESIEQEEEQQQNWNDIWATIQTVQAKPFNVSRSEELHKQVFENEQGYLQQTEEFRKSLLDPTLAEKATYERRSAQYLERQAKALEKLNKNMLEFEDVLLDRERPGPKVCSRCNVKLVDDDYDILPQLWMTKLNVTRLCQTCYMDLMETAQNFQKLQQQPKNNPKAKEETAEKTSSSSSSSRQQAVRSSNGQSNGSVAESKNGRQTTDSYPTKDDKSSSWTEVKDPDTGETFYWNDEQDEIRWEI